MEKIIITVLNDDRKCSEQYPCIHGLSLFIEADGKNILFDLGQKDCFLQNANSLGKNIYGSDYVVLSHGHYDHTDGLKVLNQKMKLICHPDCTLQRISKRTGKYNGIPYTKKELEDKFDVIFCKTPYKISQNIWFLGEIERKNDFECKTFPSLFFDGSEDTAPDDSGIAIKTNLGLIIITGCGHSGICNTVSYAQKILGENKVLAVIGGFHLKNIDEQTQKTLEFFNNLKPKYLYLGHCTSDEVIEFFKNNLESSISANILETGKTFSFKFGGEDER